MTPSQLLKRIATPVKVCEPIAPAGGPNDFATAGGHSAYHCVKEKVCPVCGAKGWNEHYYGDHPQSFFFCSANNSHTFLFDDEDKTADRIGS